MVNQVMLVGRLSEDPRVRGSGLELVLELERAPREYSPGGRCSVQVRASVSERQREAMMKYLSKGRAVLVHGYLAAFEQGLGVFGDRVEFVEDGLVSRAMDARAWPAGSRSQPAAAAVA